MNGHWFCEKCNEIVPFHAPTGRWDAKTTECLNRCGDNMRWVSGEITASPAVSAAMGQKLFDQMRDAVEKAGL